VSGARILVTGASGFVGCHLARRVFARGDTALGVALQDPPQEARDSFRGYWMADVQDLAALERVVSEAKPTAVVHLAAQSSAGLSFERPVETFAVNVVGTVALLEAVRRNAPRARVLVVGTGEVYREHLAGTRVAEDAPLRPVSPYGLSKAAADGIAESWGRLRQLDVVRTRSFGHVGPGQMEPFLLPSVARQIAEIEAGMREPTLQVGDLDIVRDLSDVRDVVEAYLALLERGQSGAVYNVCRGEGVRLDDIVGAMLARARRPIRIERDAARIRPADVRYLVGDPSAIHRDTGWRAEIGVDRTLEDILDEWRSRTPVSGVDSSRPGSG
jgi:GDP-4-dehydro-6-deoxy-D-mannose reductase